MQKNPMALGRGLVIGVAWLTWFLAGYVYATMHGPMSTLASRLSPPEKIAFAIWLLVSATLLFYAVVHLIRAFISHSPGSRD